MYRKIFILLAFIALAVATVLLVRVYLSGDSLSTVVNNPTKAKQGEELKVAGLITKIDTSLAPVDGPTKISVHDTRSDSEFIVDYPAGENASCNIESSAKISELAVGDNVEVSGVLLGRNEIAICGSSYYIKKQAPAS